MCSTVCPPDGNVRRQIERIMTEHHHRQSNRLPGWDYTVPSVYFVTICTYGREPLFNETTFRGIAENAWWAIPAHPHAGAVTLDEYVVMPDHVHGILVINDVSGWDDSVSGRGNRGVGLDDNRDDCAPVASPLRMQARSLGAIVGNFKSLVARRINALRGTPGERVWQRGYYDRIVRDDHELAAMRTYIRDNPTRLAENGTS